MFAHEDGGPEPDWIKTEREQFADFRDLNKDGKMDLDEIRHWIMPQDYDHAQAEARHLVYESDQDKVDWSGTVFSLTPVWKAALLIFISTFRINCWPGRRSWTTGTCLWAAKPPTMVKTSPGTTTNSELNPQQRRARVVLSGRRVVNELPASSAAAATRASGRISAIFNCEGEEKEQRSVQPLTRRDHLSCFFCVFFLVSVSDIQEQSRTQCLSRPVFGRNTGLREASVSWHR